MEKQFKGTPGPWHEKDNGHYYDIKCGTNKYAIYNVASCQVNEYTNPPITREIEGYNAKLIAAAPDLLVACQEALKELQFHNLHNTKTGFILEQSIKKALGE